MFRGGGEVVKNSGIVFMLIYIPNFILFHPQLHPNGKSPIQTLSISFTNITLHRKSICYSQR